MNISNGDITIEASPETVGAFPIRTDVTVLPADNPDKHKLGFKVYESIGFAIRKFVDYMQPNGDYLAPEQVYMSDRWPRDEENNPLYHEEIEDYNGIQEGDRVLVKTMFDYHYEPAIIVHWGGELCADSGGCIHTLEFRKGIDHPDFPDEKPKWISTCCINKSILDRVEL